MWFTRKKPAEPAKPTPDEVEEHKVVRLKWEQEYRDSLKPHGSVTCCEKCGASAESADRHYVEEFFDPYLCVSRAAHIKVTCTVCTYSWKERPKDFVE